MSVIVFFNSCNKEDNSSAVSYQTTAYSLTAPHGFPEPYLNKDNPMTEEGIDLGHHLYYDPILSENGKRCATCHQAQHSFSGGNFTMPDGQEISILPHINLAWNPQYDWIGDVGILDTLPLDDFGPIFFNTNMNELRKRLSANEYYRSMFMKVFRIGNFYQLTDRELQIDIVYALGQFMRTMVSADSKYDQYKRTPSTFNSSELNGYIIFMTEKGDCFHCHGDPLFTTNDYRNNGLACTPTGHDMGRYEYTHNTTDIGKFRVPTLRNVELTAPYFHDGRFQTLEEVVEFYNSGVHWNSLNIDPIMTKPFKEYGLQLTVQEKADLVAFLKTFTDTSILTNPDFANPF